MIRVLIVDDEVLIRKLLQHIVDWNALGFEIIGEAADGLQALDMVESLKPNLVMLDINLPLFDGISVLKRLNAEHREIASIMVTGYESFAYIQDAMRAGATDYVVKPIQETEVIAALNRAKQQIVKQQTLAKYTFLAKSSPDLSRKKHVNTALCIALCFEIDQYEKALRNVEERAVWVHIVREICLSLLSNYGDVEMDSEGKQMMALLYTDLLPCDLRPFESIIDDVYRNTGLSISIGISDLASSSDTADIRRKAELALSQKFLGGCGKLYRYTVNWQVYPTQKSDLQTGTNLMLALRQMDLEGVLLFLRQFFSVARTKNYCRDYVYVLASEMVNCAIRFAVEKQLNTRNALPEQEAFSSHIHRCETLEDLQFFLEGLFTNLIRFAKEFQRNGSAYIIERACTYIQEHYADDTLSQGGLAAALFVHPSYLSKLFKSIMKVGLSDYLIEYRMEKAKDLLENGRDLKIADVARCVGYTDPFYFSKSFKKIFGISPSSVYNPKIH